MTNLEAVSHDLYPYDVDESLINKRCIDFDLDPSEEYSPENKVLVAKVVISVLRRNLISLQSENNGGYSLAYRDLSKLIYHIALENGFDDIAAEFSDKPRVFVGLD